ncbi:PREDICTED: uncharacterized protein LOC104820622 [Tarenaya hassleriana]|uniref:uncharacterized protein LOC104820622 n=1 Tax=Tarenaya hassleriana TaxID=28532 RepID=UPI00053C522D|nr:PREDICTED: uncharacterized protein LOC104820622 [Tarenaya hassleriana]
MPSGAKKRKALKKKKEREQIGISKGDDNGDNLHGNDDPGSHDEKESDGNLSSPGSQGNEEAGKRDPPAFEKDIAKEKVENAVIDSIKHVVSVSEIPISTKSGEEENPLPITEKDKDDDVFTPSELAGTSEEVKNTVMESEIPESSEEKSLLASGPPVRRTSWLSCCGLFEAMTGSER